MQHINHENGRVASVTTTADPPPSIFTAPRVLIHQAFTRTALHFSSLTTASLQLKILGLIFLCGPGVFAGITGLGAAGLGNPTPVNNSLIAAYGTTAVASFFAGPICTQIGFRLSLLLGSAAFTFYSVCLIVYKDTGSGWILILGGVILGLFSSLEWTAQGTMVMTYPLPKEKGKLVSFNMTVFNLGAVLGSLVRTNLLTC